MLAVYGLIVCCLIMSCVSGTFVGVCSRIKYIFDMVLVYYSVSCSMEYVSNEVVLSFEVVSIFLSVCVIFLGGGVFLMVCCLPGTG